MQIHPVVLLVGVQSPGLLVGRHTVDACVCVCEEWVCGGGGTHKKAGVLRIWNPPGLLGNTSSRK